ncbi:response regulator transcription factor [Arcobacter defluvii]|uniref:Two-component system response regulator n=2 Tax=Arcobacter TaxID=28196 RepID=A0AAE7E5I6_9BACT|nr:response regulator transcription factor [Arcobacter defluvii]QKF76372.1 two-component system response regulator [Arcobacter defluvii]RXI34523.1 transcriptional regulator [Arcobacter defluvii]
MTISNHYNKILKTLNILYIEDEETIKENVKKTLQLFCENVLDAQNIKEAKELLQNSRIDIIISDINLPDISGIDFIKELRKIDKTIPIIILSAYTDKKYLLEATKLKLIDYLTKPVDFKSLNTALYNCVDEILDNSRYIISFKNNITYNVLQKKLINNINNEEISLTSKELNLLDLLIQNSNRVISTDELKAHIWEDEYEATDSALKNLLNKLRKKVGKESIINLSGVGYRLNY